MEAFTAYLPTYELKLLYCGVNDKMNMTIDNGPSDAFIFFSMGVVRMSALLLCQ